MSYFFTIDKPPKRERPVKPLLDKTFKSMLWKSIHIRRTAWENKYSLVFRTILNNEYKKLTNSITSDNFRDEGLPGKILSKDPIEKGMVSLYTEVGVAFAKDQRSKLKANNLNLDFKEEAIDDWVEFMTNYARVKAGKKIVSISEETIKQALKIIRSVIELSTDNGWGADETARQIRKALLDVGEEINKWRALRIARTEVITASNQGALMGAQSTGYPMEKFWIATYDQRTRDTHLVVESQNPKNMDEGFRVGAYLMECPGDPDAGPEEVINCRCSIAFQVKEII
jgi:hypothetical protein